MVEWYRDTMRHFWRMYFAVDTDPDRAEITETQRGILTAARQVFDELSETEQDILRDHYVNGTPIPYTASVYSLTETEVFKLIRTAERGLARHSGLLN